MMILDTLVFEVFCAAFLDNHLKVIACEQLFRGTLDEVPVYPREVAKRALDLNARFVILAHNHPSGENKFTPEDKETTERLIEALALFDVKIIDHILVAGVRAASMAHLALRWP